MKDPIFSALIVGASIGTGVFYNSGQALASAGPGALFTAYLFMGTVLYAVLVNLSRRQMLTVENNWRNG